MSAWTILGMAVWLVGGNALIHLGMTRVHARVRQETVAAPVVFEETVRARVTARAFLGFSVRWVDGDLVVTRRRAVLFQRSLIAQPPILIFASQAEADAPSGRFVAKLVLTEAPIVERGEVVVKASRGRTSFELRLTTGRATELAAAIRALRNEAPREADRYRDAATSR